MRFRAWHRCWFLFILGSISLAGCGGGKTDRTQLRDAARQASSIASECALFTTLKREGKLTPPFASVHALYLKKQIEEEQRQLAKAPPEDNIKDAQQALQQQLGQLEHDLESMHAAGNDAAALLKWTLEFKDREREFARIGGGL